MKSHFYKKRRNASVIAYSPNFDAAVRRARSELGIPAQGFGTKEERDNWYERHHATSTKELLRPMPPYYWHFPKQFAEMLDSFSYTAEPSRVNFYPEVPLDRCAMDLVRKFDLSEDVVSQAKAYILGDAGQLGIGVALQPIFVPINEGEEGIKYVALVAGLDEATTQKDWLEVWTRLEMILRMRGTSKVSPRRPDDNLFLRDLNFWTQIKAGKTAKDVATRWTDRHPKDKAIGEDTVRKAVERIDEIMRIDM